jgi:hypothetical protein
MGRAYTEEDWQNMTVAERWEADYSRMAHGDWYRGSQVNAAYNEELARLEKLQNEGKIGTDGYPITRDRVTEFRDKAVADFNKGRGETDGKSWYTKDSDWFGLRDKNTLSAEENADINSQIAALDGGSNMTFGDTGGKLYGQDPMVLPTKPIGTQYSGGPLQANLSRLQQEPKLKALMADQNRMQQGQLNMLPNQTQQEPKLKALMADQNRMQQGQLNMLPTQQEATYNVPFNPAKSQAYTNENLNKLMGRADTANILKNKPPAQFSAQWWEDNAMDLWKYYSTPRNDLGKLNKLMDVNNVQPKTPYVKPKIPPFAKQNQLMPYTDKFGIYHGQGTHNFESGAKYSGGFKDDNYHGKGTYTSADGGKYIGEFRDNTLHGKGTYTYADGSIKDGYWENNKYIGSSKELDNIISKSPEFNGVDGFVGFVHALDQSVKDIPFLGDVWSIVNPVTDVQSLYDHITDPELRNAVIEYAMENPAQATVGGFAMYLTVKGGAVKKLWDKTLGKIYNRKKKKLKRGKDGRMLPADTGLDVAKIAKHVVVGYTGTKLGAEALNEADIEVPDLNEVISGGEASWNSLWEDVTNPTEKETEANGNKSNVPNISGNKVAAGNGSWVDRLHQPIRGGAGSWDTNFNRGMEMLEYAGTPLSKRGDHPSKGWRASDTAANKANAALIAARMKAQSNIFDDYHNWSPKQIEDNIGSRFDSYFGWDWWGGKNKENERSRFIADFMDAKDRYPGKGINEIFNALITQGNYR